MKKLIFSIFALMLLLTFAACKDSKVIGETTQGTPIVEVVRSEVVWQDTPTSDCFSEIGYDADAEILYVRFRDSGAAYRYLDYPSSEWEKFSVQNEPGKWYNKNIKGQYESQKIGE